MKQPNGTYQCNEHENWRQLQMNWLKFKTSQRFPIILEETREYTSNNIEKLKYVNM